MRFSMDALPDVARIDARIHRGISAGLRRLAEHDDQRANRSLRRSPLAPLTGVVLAALVLAPVHGARAVNANLNGSQDNTIYSETTPINRQSNSNGAGHFIVAGRVGGPAVRRGLIEFDVAASIPAGATITSVTLTLRAGTPSNSSTSTDISLFRLTQSWGEASTNAGEAVKSGGGAAAVDGDATWISRFHPGSPWSGGTFLTNPARATTSVSTNGDYSWSHSNMRADVQAWLDGTLANHGWLLKDGETTDGTVKWFHSKEHGTTTTRPKLTVVYTLPSDDDDFLTLIIQILGAVASRP